MNKDRTILSDGALVEMFINGDSAAFGEIVKRHSKSISAVLFPLLHDPMLVEDFLQDTFIKAMNAIRNGESYKEMGALKYWLGSMAHNLAVDFIRKQKRRPRAFSISTTGNFEETDHGNYFPIGDIEKSVEEKIIMREMKYNICELVDLLPTDQKEVVVLRHFHNFSFAEIAQYTNVSINTALGRMRYALINIRRQIEKIESSGRKVL